MIRAKNISLSFNGINVFKDMTFNIEHGSNVCFYGPSGTGKSSLLKILQGYIIPDAGLIEVDNMKLDMANIKQIRSMMTYVPQNINLPVDNGKELLKLVNNGDADDKVNYYIEELGMPADMLERRFDEMSGGQKQRIVIAICLSLGREITLLDEPTSSLDDDSIGKLIRVIQNLNNRTVVSASHNHKWIRFADKTIMLRKPNMPGYTKNNGE
jgi:putative ABC transport system ATP-binding protein